MKRLISAGVVVAWTTLLSVSVLAQSVSVNVPQIEIKPLGSYASGIFDDSAAEIVDYDPRYALAYVTNSAETSLDVLSIWNPRKPRKITSIDLSPYGAPNSVAVKNGIVAVAVAATDKQTAGSVVFFNRFGYFLNQLEVGALPDMLTFTPDGSKLVVANEGEPNDDYSVDPEGTISIIDMSKHIKALTQNDVSTAEFTDFNNVAIDERIRIFGPNASVAQDLEPEYIAISPDSQTAYVALQENNALAVVDLAAAQVSALVGLGTKNFNTIQTAIDASDTDGGINIQPWPVVGMYQPDSIAAYEADGETYIVTANEGDARDYDGFSEERRVEDLSLDIAILQDNPLIQMDEQLGRLKTTSVNGDSDGDGDVDQIYAYGGRSFSIWNSAGEIVYDSGSDFARITAANTPEIFNANDGSNFDTRSDDKGAEPEALTLGKIGNATYVFIGLERTGGIMVYDISNPIAPNFVQYINNFDPVSGTGDIAPEGLRFVSSIERRGRKPLLLVANEVSGTTTVYAIQKRKNKE